MYACVHLCIFLLGMCIIVCIGICVCMYICVYADVYMHTHMCVCIFQLCLLRNLEAIAVNVPNSHMLISKSFST